MTNAKTRIGSPPTDTSRLRMRGKDVLTEVVGKLTFAETFFLISLGRVPTATERKVLDTALVMLMDHGLTQNAVVARLVEDSVPEDIQVPIAAGLLMVGNKFIGTMAGAGKILAEGHAHAGDKAQWAEEVVRRHRETKRRMPGFGHPYYKGEDPRAKRLFEIAREAGVKGDYIALALLLKDAAGRAAGRPVPLNATGALAAVLSEIAFPIELMRAVAVIGRCAGLAAHIYEEKTSPIVPELLRAIEQIPYEE
jgi:citrate synthase